MLEMLVNPKKAERRPWEMFFVGLFYASLSILLVDWIFLRDSVLSGYTSMLIITFSVMFTIPFMYFIIRLEEKKDAAIKREYDLLREHGKAIAALTYLFLGFIVAFAFWFLVMPPATTAENFKSQIAQYCAINMPQQFERCLSQQGISVTGIGGKFLSARIASGTPLNYFTSILINNIYVLIFILIFSFAFGAGAIFILAWNASVIASAIGIFADGSLKQLHIGLMRYLIHGAPELIAYFIAALAGGILSIAVIRHEFGKEKFWRVLQDSIDLIIIALVILVIAALIEVFITPALF